MFRKNNRRFENEQRKTNAFGWSRKRGGAGAVVCAMAVALLVISMAFTVTARPAVDSPAYVDEPQPHDDYVIEDPWEQPQKEIPQNDYRAGIPSRLPI